MQLTLKTVERKEVATPNGREPSAIKVGVQANELGGKWASCFETEYTKHWKAGDVVEIVEVAQKGKYLNIVLPRPVRLSAPSGQPLAQAGRTTNKEDVAAEMLATLKSIAMAIVSQNELVTRVLHRMEDRNKAASAVTPGEAVRLPSGGCTEKREQPPEPADEEQPDGDDLPF